MFCYQCEQTAHGTACTEIGVCGKTDDVAALQDLLVHAAKGVSQYAHRAAQLGARDADVDRFVVDALFTTVTNVNFDAERMAEMVRKAATVRDAAKSLYEQASLKAGLIPAHPEGPATWTPVSDVAGLVGQGKAVSIMDRIQNVGEDITGLQELLIYGAKGAAAYAAHAAILGKEDDGIYAFFHEALDFLTVPEPAVDDLLAINLKCGEVSVGVLAHHRVLGRLDKVAKLSFGSALYQLRALRRRHGHARRKIRRRIGKSPIARRATDGD